MNTNDTNRIQINKKLQEQLTEEMKTAEDWKNKALRSLADYRNLEKRTQDELMSRTADAQARVFARLLPIVDSIEKLRDHIKDAAVDVVVKQLMAFLEEANVKKVDVVGKPFDPHTMECIETVEGGDGIVIEETEPGYMRGDTLLRVAKVKVGKQKGG